MIRVGTVQSVALDSSLLVRIRVQTYERFGRQLHVFGYWKDGLRKWIICEKGSSKTLIPRQVYTVDATESKYEPCCRGW
jgi:hypothetical protein